MIGLYISGGFVLGLVVYHYAHAHGLTGERLTKEEYARCVQMVMADERLSREKSAVLIAHLQNYAMDDEVAMSKLPNYCQEVIKKVKNDL